MKLKMDTILRPKNLNQGSCVAFAAPSSHFRREYFDEAFELLVSFGYDVRYREDIFSRESYLAGSDERRLTELSEFLSDESIDAIFLLRGGYGSARMFNLPVKKMKISHPKFVLGMSDHTFLINFLAYRNSMVTYHAPILTGDVFRLMELSQKKNLLQFLLNQQKVNLQPPQYQLWNRGNAKGILWGGNLSIVQTMIGTPFYPNWKNSILFLEENNEMEYRIDRTFAHLNLAGIFSKVSAVLLGDFTDKDNRPHLDSFLQRMVDRYVPREVPVLAGLKSGHVNGELILPIGSEIEIQNMGKRLRFFL